MSDQADGLRQWVRARSAPTALADRREPNEPRRGPARARSLLLTSGKGGVGTSNLTLNLAIALGEFDQRVIVVDAALGRASLDLLCGLTPAHDLADVLAGECSLSDALVTGPGNIRLIAGAPGVRLRAELLESGPARLAADLAELDDAGDFVLIDAGSGLDPGIATLATAADQVVVLTTPEPTSVADAHAAIGQIRRALGPVELTAIVNQAASPTEAQDVLARLGASSRQFLGAVVTAMGHIRIDPHVALAVRARRPFVIAYPGSAAARDVRRLARRLIEKRQPRSRRAGFFAALAARWSAASG
jgi:flagellar biosynthesis protein FlhG